MCETGNTLKGKAPGLAAFLAGCAILIWLDQWTKTLAVTHLKGQDPIIIWDGVFQLQYLENRGAAFGMLQGRQIFFFLIALLVLAAVAYALYRMPLPDAISLLDSAWLFWYPALWETLLTGCASSLWWISFISA